MPRTGIAVFMSRCLERSKTQSLQTKERDPVLIVRVTTLFMGAVDMSYFLKDKDVEFLPGCSAEHRLGPQEREVAPGRTVDVYEVFLRSRPNCVLAVTAIT